MIRTDDTVVQKRRHASGFAWIVVSFGLLVAGVLAGAAINGRGWAWVPPVAGFVGYILSFRRGLLSWNADGLWREPVSGRERPEDENPEPRVREVLSCRASHTMRVVR